MTKSKQMSETHLIGLLLALVGGFLDAYTYICRGRVFANAQTGNIVLLGIQLTDRNFQKAFYYLMPILAFTFGILTCEVIQSLFKWKKSLHWRQLIILAELVCLIAAGFMPVKKTDTLVNIMVSFVCALQVEAFRKMNGNSYATTMCTGNLRSAAEHLFHFIKAKDIHSLKNSLQYYDVIFFFTVGAAAGGFLSIRLGAKAVWVSCIGLFAVFAAMFRKDKENIL